MPFELADIETQLGLLDWRNGQLEAVTDQLEQAFPNLSGAIIERIAAMSSLEVGRAHLNPRPLAESLIAPWAAEQSRIAFNRAEASLSGLISSLKLEGSLADHLGSALPALTGVGMLAASVLGLPAIVSYATITTTSFLVFSTSTISIPLLLAGGTVLAGMSFAGVKAFDQAKDKMRVHLAARVQSLALAAIFGHGLAPDERYLLNDLQAAILKSGQTQLEAIA